MFTTDAYEETRIWKKTADAADGADVIAAIADGGSGSKFKLQLDLDSQKNPSEPRGSCERLRLGAAGHELGEFAFAHVYFSRIILRPMSEGETQPDLVEVYRGGTITAAADRKRDIEAEGVLVTLRDDLVDGGAVLMVRSDHAKRAKELLGQVTSRPSQESPPLGEALSWRPWHLYVVALVALSLQAWPWCFLFFRIRPPTPITMTVSFPAFVGCCWLSAGSFSWSKRNEAVSAWRFRSLCLSLQ